MGKEEILKTVGAGEAYDRLVKGDYSSQEEKEALQYLASTTDEQIAEAKGRDMAKG